MPQFRITIVAFLSCLASVNSQPFDYPTANLSSSWINSVSIGRSATLINNSVVRPILLRGTMGPSYACGFYCNGTCETYLFAIYIVQTNSGGGVTGPSIGFPQVVWSANRHNPVRINAKLELTSGGDLVLRDADGTLAWSTNTSGKSVAGLNLTKLGNLVLFDEKNSVVWQSFDHPTDVLVPGQILVSGTNLTASASLTNWSDGGLFSLSMSDTSFVAFIQSDPPEMYYQNIISRTKKNVEASNVKYVNGSLDFYVNGVEPQEPDMSITLPRRDTKVEPGGHLRVYEWGGASGIEIGDIFSKGHLDGCEYPMVCGRYGICSNGQCSCPNGTSFRQASDRRPDLGCSQVIPVTCNDSSNHSFLDLVDVSYFSFIYDINTTNVNSCKEACLKNCSCKAAIFRYGSNSSDGFCYMPSEIFSLMNNEHDLTHYNSSVFLKVQIAPIAIPTPVEKKTSILGPILGSTLGLLCVAVVIGTIVFVYRRRRRSEEVEEDYLDHVPGMPTRFSFEELAIATDNFNKETW